MHTLVESFQCAFATDGVAQEDGEKVDHLVVSETTANKAHVRVDIVDDALLAKIGDDQRVLPEPEGRRRGRRGRNLDTLRDIGDTVHAYLLVGNKFVLPHQGGIFLGWFATDYISLRNSWAQLAAAEAVRAQLALMQGHLAAAVRWAEASGLSAEDDPSYPREREYLTFARVRIAQGRRELAGPFLAEALCLLERLQADAEAKARLDSLLEILVLRALALFAVEAHRRHALTALERALLLGKQEGYIRLFVDEGEPMVALLRQAYARGIAPDYVVTLLSALGEQTRAAPSRASAPGENQPHNSSLDTCRRAWLSCILRAVLMK